MRFFFSAQSIPAVLLVVATLNTACQADRETMVRELLMQAVGIGDDERKLRQFILSVGQQQPRDPNHLVYANYFGNGEFVISVCDPGGNLCMRANQTKEICDDMSGELQKMARNAYVLEMAYQQETGAFSLSPDSIGFDTRPSTGYVLRISKATKEGFDGTLCSIQTGECVIINERGEGPKRVTNDCRRVSETNNKKFSSDGKL